MSIYKNNDAMQVFSFSNFLSFGTVWQITGTRESICSVSTSVLYQQRTTDHSTLYTSESPTN